MAIGPKLYRSGEWPESIVALTQFLMPRLLAGESAALAVLRPQYEAAEIAAMESSGAGFFVKFEVPDGAPVATTVGSVVGGDALIELSCHRFGAGCVLWIRDGRLDVLEYYTYGDSWPDDAKVLSVSDVRPVLDQQ